MSLVSAVYDNGKLRTKYEYDERGNETRKTRYKEDSSIYTDEHNEYDEYDNIIRSIYVNDGETSEYKSEYSYDKNGNVISKLSLEDDGEYSYKYKYDKNGNRIEYICTKNGIVQSHTKSEYDDKGNMIKEDMYSRTGALVGTTVYEYDEMGNNTLNVFSYNGVERQRSVYTYDDKGNLLEDVYYDEEGEGSREKYTYDENGNQTEWLSLFQSEFSGRYTYEYNEKNQLVKESYFEFENDTEPYYTEEYAYNEKGLLTGSVYRNKSDKKAEKIAYEYIAVSIPAYRVDAVKEAQELILL